MTPRTLSELRAAVARVLQARGEAADALVCEIEPQAGGVWHASILATTCGALIDWLIIGGNTRDAAIAAMWRRFVIELEHEHDSAKHCAASTRRPERRAAADVRLAHATAALAVARETGGGG